jgi:hypothetical protein
MFTLHQTFPHLLNRSRRLSRSGTLYAGKCTGTPGHFNHSGNELQKIVDGRSKKQLLKRFNNKSLLDLHTLILKNTNSFREC